VNTGTRQPWIFAAATVAGCLTLALYLGRPTGVEQGTTKGARPATEVGRYQVATQGTNLYLVDSSTGRIWNLQAAPDPKQPRRVRPLPAARRPELKWVEAASPPSRKKPLRRPPPGPCFPPLASVLGRSQPV
jgi:hypothetical protein